MSKNSRMGRKTPDKQTNQSLDHARTLSNEDTGYNRSPITLARHCHVQYHQIGWTFGWRKKIHVISLCSKVVIAHHSLRLCSASPIAKMVTFSRTCINKLFPIARELNNMQWVYQSLTIYKHSENKSKKMNASLIKKSIWTISSAKLSL